MSSDKSLPTIAILGGTGSEGPGLAMRWVLQGYPIIIGSRKTEKAQRVAEELNNTLSIDSIHGMENSQAARSADICILTVVHTAHMTAVEGLKDDLQGKILVDATARIDFRQVKPPSPPSAARIAQNILGENVRVVAAFQNIAAKALKENLDQPLSSDVLVCSDDLAAFEEVRGLAKSIGMRALYAGDLDNAIVVEGLTAIMISLNKHYHSSTASIQVTGINSQA